MWRRATPGPAVVLLLAVAALGLMRQCLSFVPPSLDTYDFEDAVYAVAEDVGTVTVYVIRTGPHVAADSTVDVATTDGTAVDGTDYTADTATLDFQLTNNRVAFTVSVTDNATAGTSPYIACFTLTLSSPSPSGNLGDPSQVCIIDNDNFFAGTCPPPEAVIESNGEPVIEVNVTSGSATAVITWTDPTPSGLQMVYTCFPHTPEPDHECDNGDAFPISYTFNAADEYDRRILVSYSVFSAFLPVPIKDDCDFYLRVLDPIPPAITCPADVEEAAGEGYMNGTADWMEPVGTDNSGQVTTNTHSPPLVLTIGSHEFTYTAVDSSGNEASCSFDVTISDLTDPEVECPLDIDTATDPLQSYATVTWSAPNVTDNSGEDITPMLSSLSGSTFEIGSHTVDVTATDSHNNIGNCSFTVVVRDDEPPMITCRDNQTNSTDLNSDSVSLSLPGAASASDNSGSYNITIYVAGTPHNVGDTVTLDLATGQHLLQYSIIDSAMYMDTCNMYITVIDDEDPMIICPPAFTVGTDEGLATANVTWDLATVTDNSMIAITPVDDPASGSVLDIGETTVQFNATDESSNSASCTFVVTVEDTEPPSINCTNLTFSTSPGLPTAFVTYLEPTATDNVGVMNVNCFGVESSGEELGVGTHSVVCVAIDTSMEGLAVSCELVITVEDNETPNITCPVNETVSTDAGAVEATYALPDLESSVDNTENFTVSIDVAGTPYVIGDNVMLSLAGGMHLVQYTATDSYMNSQGCDMFVTVIDDEDPMIICPPAFTVGTDEGLATANVTWDLATVTDNSMIAITPVADLASGSVLDIGDTTVQFNATDGSDNSASCTFVVTVEDDEDPVVECPMDIEVNADMGQNYATVTWYAPNATDNSGGPITLSLSHASGSQFAFGPTTVTVNATDSSSNLGSCNFTVNVVDDEPPMITCRDNQTNSTDLNSDSVSLSLPGAAFASDNSGSYTITIEVVSMTYNIGDTVTLDLATEQHLLQYIITDSAMYTDTCNMYITVIDDEDPMIICPPAFTVGTDEGLATANVTWDLATVTDNSMIAITPVDDPASGSVLDIGETTVQFSATDGSDNSASCTFVVTVEDTEPPSINCTNLTFSTSPGLPTAFVTYLEPTATDNVGVMNVNCFGVESSGEELGVGTHSVVCVAIDTSMEGLAVSCELVITVEDNETPNITCPVNETVSTDAGAVEATYALPDLESSVDNTENFTVSIDVAGTPYVIGNNVMLSLAGGVHLVQYTATDSYMNSQGCDMFVTVIDDEDPIIICPPAFTVGTDEGLATANATWDLATVTDNSMLAITPVADPASGSVLDIGDTTVQFNATDGSDNSASCTFVVTVEDDEDPVVECPMDIEVNADMGQNYATVTWYAPNATDNSGGPITLSLSHASGSQFAFGPTTVTVNATDSSSNLGSCNFTVNVVDDEPPMITCRDNQTNSTDLNSDSVSLSLPGAAFASDNSGSYTITIEVVSMTYDIGDTVTLDLATEQHLLQYIITDSAMYTDTCDMYITVIDDEDPMIICPPAFTVGTDEGLATANVTWDLATVTDNSMIAITPVDDPASGSVLDIGETTVQFSATDGSDNSASCTFVVTVEDTEPPSINCTNLTFSTSPGLPTAFVTYLEPTATDNVGVMNVNCFGVESSGEELGVGTHSVVCVAIDTSMEGLAVSCELVITVEDNETPNITCPVNETVSTDAGAVEATYALPDLESSVDNTENFTVSIDVAGTPYVIGNNVMLSLAGGVHLVQYTATDSYMNSQGCDMFVTVIDDEDPIIICPPAFTVGTDEGLATANATWDLATVTDNSMLAITPVADPASGSVLDIGDTTVQFNATDGSDNSASCTFVVTVEDDEDPVVECPMDIEVNADMGQNYATVTWYAPNATDNSGGPITLSLSHASGSQFAFGPTTVTVNATDSSSNLGSCNFTVNVVDDEPPMITCRDNQTNSTDLNSDSVSLSLPDADSASDNSGSYTITIEVVGMTYDIGDSVALDLATGQHLLHYIITDSASNSDTCDMYITVIDEQAPDLTCPEDQVVVVPDGQLEAAITWPLLTVTDNSGEVPQAFPSLDNGTSVPIGDKTTIVYNATDAAGNIGYCNFSVLVIDNVPPVITCPSDLTKPTAFNQSYGPVTWDPPVVTDNVPSTVTVTSDRVNGSIFHLGDTVVTLTAVDAVGNNDTCQFTITVADMEPPIIYNCPDNFNVTTEQGQAYGIPVFTEPTATDNLGSFNISGLGQSGTQFPIGPTEVLYVAVDLVPLSTICSVTIFVIDDEMPGLQSSSQCPADIVAYIQDAALDNVIVTWTDPVFEDNSGVAPSVTVTPLPNNSPFPLGNTNVTILAEDQCGNWFECVFLVTIKMYDMTPPVFSACPPVVTSVTTDPGLDTASPFDFGVTVSDAGSGVESSVLSTDEAFSIGDNFVSLFARDFAGNVDYCNFTVTVADNEMPNVTSCPGKQTVFTQTGRPYGFASWTEPVAVDNSGDVTVNCSKQSGDAFDIADTTVVCTAWDPSDNMETCSFIITVIDDEDPVLVNCQPNATVYVLPNATQASASWPFPTATDNAGPPTVFNATYTAVSVVGQNPIAVTVDWQAGFVTVQELYIGHYQCIIRAEDASGNSVECVTEVWILVYDDTTLPVISNCPSDIERPTATGLATASVTWTAPTATDDRGAVTLTSDISPGSDFTIGTTEVTYTAVDGNNNQVTCSFTVTVVDEENPTLTNCPVSFMLVVTQTMDQALAEWTPPTAADNSGVVTRTTTFDPGQMLSAGQYPVTYTATDPAGLTATCEFTVTIQTNTACDNSPCNNGGACAPVVNDGFVCTCTSFWMGTTCDEDVNECATDQATAECSDRGLVCYNRLDPIGYSCDCPVGFVTAGNSNICILGRSFRITLVIIEINGLVAVFVTDMGNSNSYVFLFHQTRLQALFVLVFGHLPGFGNVIVLYFSPGSIVVDAVVNFDPDSTVTQEDVDNALTQGITTGDLLMESEYKVTPSSVAVIEEVCVDGFCQNGGTCVPSSGNYLSTCTCPSGYVGDRCENMIQTTLPPGDEGLPTEAIVAIAVGAAVLLLLILLVSLAVCCLMARGRGRRSDYLYREDYEGRTDTKRRTNGSVYDVQFQPREYNGYRPTGQFTVPYMASGGEPGIPLQHLVERRDADYY